MSTSFPTGLDNFTNPTAGQTLAAGGHTALHGDNNDAIEALEAKVGVDASAVTTSLDFLLKGVLGVFTQDEITVTGAVTATAGRAHLCSGTAADYTVTLPTAVGNTNRLLGFRMAPGLTRLVTLDGDGTETVAGALTRVLWANEVAVFRSDGANWQKVLYEFRPMICRMRRDASQTGVVTATITKVTINAIDLDTTAGVLSVPMGDTTGNVINVLRAGRYRCTAGVRFENLSGTATRIEGFVVIGATLTGTQYAFSETHAEAGSYPMTPGADLMDLVAGDFVTLAGFHNVGSNQSFYGHATNQSPSVTLEELQPW